MNEPILKVENMNKKFGSTIALNNVSLTVYPGEIRGLIGENGSGKSTVTSIVAGMQPCDSGTMTFKGQDWKPLSMIDGTAQRNRNDRSGKRNNTGNNSGRKYFPGGDREIQK